jgi:glycosyltransferase involved in cell wall biosynthesis
MDKKNAIVSIIVPCYNYGKFLGECLKSVQSQTFPQWECIIIDNGSTDNTKEVAHAFTNSDHRFKYIYSEQKGVSFARNLAVRSSVGSYILPLDADDKIAPSYIEKAVKILDNNPSVKVVYCDAELFGASSGKWILPPYSFKDILMENLIFCTALYRKTDFDQAGGYNENMREGFEDWDFWISMLKSGGEVHKIPEILFYYRIRHDSRNNRLDTVKQLALRQRIYENHKGTYDRYFSIPDLLYRQYLLKTQLDVFERSRDRKIGKLIMAPLRFIKKLFYK